MHGSKAVSDWQRIYGVNKFKFAKFVFMLRRAYSSVFCRALSFHLLLVVSSSDDPQG
jgi:hypothetical protein